MLRFTHIVFFLEHKVGPKLTGTESRNEEQTYS